MIKWLKQYYEASPQTKFFILNWVIYGVAIIITTIYCYARLEFVRSDREAHPTEKQDLKD